MMRILQYDFTPEINLSTASFTIELPENVRYITGFFLIKDFDTSNGAGVVTVSLTQNNKTIIDDVNDMFLSFAPQTSMSNIEKYAIPVNLVAKGQTVSFLFSHTSVFNDDEKITYHIFLLTSSDRLPVDYYYKNEIFQLRRTINYLEKRIFLNGENGRLLGLILREVNSRYTEAITVKKDNTVILDSIDSRVLADNINKSFFDRLVKLDLANNFYLSFQKNQTVSRSYYILFVQSKKTTNDNFELKKLKQKISIKGKI